MKGNDTVTFPPTRGARGLRKKAGDDTCYFSALGPPLLGGGSGIFLTVAVWKPSSGW